MDTSSDGATTPKHATSSSTSSEAGPVTKSPPTRNVNEFSSSNLDPALGGSSSPAAGEMSEEQIKANENWVTNARTIEALRAWVHRRLEQYDSEDKSSEKSSEMDHDGASSEVKQEKEKDVVYPALDRRASE